SQCAGTLRAALPVVARFDQRRYSLVDLGVPGGANWTAAAGISRQGQRVTGIWGEANGLFVWDGALHAESFAPASAGAINSAGTVVGTFSFGRLDSHAFRWQSGQPADLGTLGGTASAAYGINDQGIVVGWALRA